MPDIKDLKNIKEVSDLGFNKIIDDLLNSFKPTPLLPLDLNKIHITTLADVVAYLKGLKAAVVEGSRQANRLSQVIKNLTQVLVGLTAAAVILAAISLYVLFSSR